MKRLNSWRQQKERKLCYKCRTKDLAQQQSRKWREWPALSTLKKQSQEPMSIVSLQADSKIEVNMPSLQNG
jgi:hypothetical protein